MDLGFRMGLMEPNDLLGREFGKGIYDELARLGADLAYTRMGSM